MRDDRFLTCTSCGTRFWVADAISADAPALCPGCCFTLPAAGRQRGVVKFYNGRKGWGFVTQPDGKEVFFHRSGFAPGVEPPMLEGELVEYSIEDTTRGPQAVQLLRLEAKPAALVGS